MKQAHPAATMLMWLDEVKWSRGKASPGLLLLLSRGSGWDGAQKGAGAVSIPGRAPRPRSPRAARCRSCTARWGAGGCWSSPRRTWCRRSGEKAKEPLGEPRGGHQLRVNEVGGWRRASPSCSPRRRRRRSRAAPAAPRRGCSGSRRPPARCGACPPGGSSGAWREGTGDIQAVTTAPQLPGASSEV